MCSYILNVVNDRAVFFNSRCPYLVICSYNANNTVTINCGIDPISVLLSW